MRTYTTQTFLVYIILCLSFTSIVHGQKITIGETGDYPNLSAAASIIQAGDTLEMQSQVFTDGTQFLYDLEGTAEAPIVIIAKERHQTIMRGGTESIHLVRCHHVEINGLTIEGQTGNGMNIDDGGDYSTPSEHIVVRNCMFREMEASGNNDLLKMSGIDNFLIENCSFVNGGEGGSGVDFVGCHYGVVQDCVFDNSGTSGIQNKGGTQHIRIQRNVFTNISQRALNLGGSTGLQFFRPPLADPIVDAFEAADIEVFSNVFIGNHAPIAYVGAVRVKVFNNTFYQPQNWVFRILQETTTPGFLTCADNEFKNNIVYLESDLTEVNIGPNTDPESFKLSNNLWYNQSSNNWTPNLPVIDVDQIIASPGFMDESLGNFRLLDGSAAIAKGAVLTEVTQDFDLKEFSSPPSIGAFEGNTTISSILEQQSMESIHMYPNPASTQAQVHMDLEDEDLLLMIYDISGKLMLNQNLVNKQLDLSKYNLEPGQYFVKAIGNDARTYSAKLFLY